MRWVIKTSLDGKFFDDVLCDGTPFVPESGSKLLIPVDGYYASGIVTEFQIDQERDPAVLTVTCLNPDAFEKS